MCLLIVAGRQTATSGRFAANVTYNNAAVREGLLTVGLLECRAGAALGTGAGRSDAGTPATAPTEMAGHHPSGGRAQLANRLINIGKS